MENQKNPVNPESNENQTSKETAVSKEKNREQENTGKRELTDTLFSLYVDTLFYFMVGQTLGGFLCGMLECIPAGNKDIRDTAMTYFLFIGIWIIFCLYMRFTKKNRPILEKVGTKAKGNNWKYVLLGLVIGFGLNGSCILVAWLHKDIHLSFSAFEPLPLLFILITVFIQSSAEELACRGFLYQRLRRSYENPAVAIVGNSLLFTILHLFNDGVTILSLLNIFLTGIMFSFMVYYMDSLWCAMTVHTAWNFTQNIVFGLPNSGMMVPYSVFKLDTKTASDSFAYNVGFGIEGTLVADVVLALFCLLLFWWGQKQHKHNCAA